jgi:hypothetical protein
MFGGIIFFSRARTALMQDVMPDAPSEWPFWIQSQLLPYSEALELEGHTKFGLDCETTIKS